MVKRVSYALSVGADGKQTGLAPTATAPVAQLTPPGTAWPGLLRAHAARTAADPQAANFRSELGLPTGKPVVMSGHQAQWWHAGIFAKQIALAALCEGASAAGAWVVVDQDASDSLTIAYPARAVGGTLPSRGTWALAPEPIAAHLRADVALCDLPTFAPTPPPTDAATPDIARALRAIADCTARWAHAASAAEQIARANAELAAAALGPAQTPTLFFATDLLRTAAARALIERMAEDPAACSRAYNRAVAESGVHTVAPLSAAPDKGRFELPLWQLSGKGNKPTPRRRVFASTLGDTPLDSLAPRGVLMTALLRWPGCDLFIHGTGGGATGEAGGYDKVAEHWMRNWLGAELAPSVVATATALLPMGAAPTLAEPDLVAAHRRLENARHAPRTLGDAAAQRHKDALVAQIAATADRSERLRLYKQLQHHLEAYRTAHAAELQAAGQAAADTAEELGRQSILRERTWPWPLLPRTMVLELQRTVRVQLKP
ncbi:MAG: hypothetical protein Q8L55_03500 [Phycisphaerales bacterium]|nr:hypothetical protein [Phycisphaerales bacterium]